MQNLVQLDQDKKRVPVGFEPAGVALGDNIFIYPIEGGKRQIVLNRTKMNFTGSSHFSKRNYGSSWTFPTLLSDHGGELLITLETFRRHHDGASIRRYRIHSAQPFLLNGVWCSEAYPRHGDILDFCLNRFIFKAADQLQAPNNELLTQKEARSLLPILLEGETGTGKTTLAKKIHDESGVIGKFVHLNLASFSPSLLESEIFGHKKGAFTGAIRDKQGALLEANRGTLFLDEVDSLPIDIQTKLLLFLDNGHIRAVGDSRVAQSKARIIAASGSSLKGRLAGKEMRQDFYHRLASGVQVRLKSLREDRLAIARFVSDFAKQNQMSLCPLLLEEYQNFSWPGNKRQLQGHLEKKRLLGSMQRLAWCHLDEDLFELRGELGVDSHEITSMRELKRVYARQVYLRCSKNSMSAAKALKISENTLKKLVNQQE